LLTSSDAGQILAENPAHCMVATRLWRHVLGHLTASSPGAHLARIATTHAPQEGDALQRLYKAPPREQ